MTKKAAGDWRGETLARMRKLIQEADPAIVETVKWVKPSNPAGVPVFERDGIVCTGETYKAVVKLTFAQGAALGDPAGLFNASLDGHVRRAIDIKEGETVDAAAFKALIRAAVAHNAGKRQNKAKGTGQAKAQVKGQAKAKAQPKAKAKRQVKS
jgi:hypothetical protein